MSTSAEFITATIFATVMVLIGLGAIWIVRWQTYFLLRHQIQDPERHSAETGARTSRLESTELETLRHPSSSCSTINHESRVDFGDSSHIAEDGYGMVSGTRLFGPVCVGHMPSTGVLENHGRNIEGPSGLGSTTSSCSSTLHHDPSVAVINDNRAATESFPVS